MAKRRPVSTFTCPHCGANVPSTAHACPECGSDDDTGWSEDHYIGGLDLPDDDYDDVDDRPSESRMGLPKWAIALAAGLLILMFLRLSF